MSADIILRIKDNFSDSSKRADLLKNSIGSITSSVSSLTKSLLGVSAAYIGVVTVATKANATQVRNEIALSHALGFTHESLKTINKDVLDFASKMQDVSGIGDEEVLRTMTRIAAATNLTGEAQKKLAKEGAKAAAILGIQSGKGLEFGTEAISRSLTGTVTRLEQFAPAVANLSEAQAKAGDQIAIINKRYDGLLEKTGKLDPIARIMGRIADVTEAAGDAISISLAPAFDIIEGKFKGLSDTIKSNNALIGQTFADIGTFIISFSQTALTVLRPVVEIVSRIGAGLDLIGSAISAGYDIQGAAYDALTGNFSGAKQNVREAQETVSSSIDRGVSTIEGGEKMQQIMQQLSNTMGQINNSLQRAPLQTGA